MPEKSLNHFKLLLIPGLKTFSLTLAGLPVGRQKREWTFHGIRREMAQILSDTWARISPLQAFHPG